MKNRENPFARIGENPDFDAWFTAFFLKNSLDPFAYPAKVASKEQIEFMVFPENGERYFPCSDKMFDAIMSRKYPPLLKKSYQKVFDEIMDMIDELIDSEYDRQFLKALIKIKYDDDIQTGLLIPSRLEKKLHKIFLSRTHIENPYSEFKNYINKKIKKIIDSEIVETALNQIDDSLKTFENLSLFELREKIKEIEFQRRLTLITQNTQWIHENSKLSLSGIKKIFKTPVRGDGLSPLLSLIRARKQKILWLADESCDVVIDLTIAKFLADLGHAVIFAVKEAPF